MRNNLNHYRGLLPTGPNVMKPMVVGKWSDPAASMTVLETLFSKCAVVNDPEGNATILFGIHDERSRYKLLLVDYHPAQTFSALLHRPDYFILKDKKREADGYLGLFQQSTLGLCRINHVECSVWGRNSLARREDREAWERYWEAYAKSAKEELERDSL